VRKHTRALPRASSL